MALLIKISPVIVLATVTLWRLYSWDFFHPISPYSTLQNCLRIDDIPNLFAEDIEIDRKTGIAYFSVSDFSKLSQPIPFEKDGFISKYDIKSRQHKVMKLVAPENFSFNPHGISLFRDTNTETLYLFAVSHRNDRKDYMEVFLVDEVNEQLVHQNTVHSDLFKVANSIVAVSPTEFYVTNFVGSDFGSFIMTLEAVTDRPWANILFCDLSSCKIAANGLISANGLAKSLDGSHVFLGHTLTKQFTVFLRNTSSNELSLIETHPLQHTADNVDVDELIQIWIAGSTVKGTIDSSSQTPGELPSLVSMATYPPFEMKPILVDNGSLIQLATTAAQWNGNVLLSSYISPFVVHCQIQI